MMKKEKRTIYISASANEILTDYIEDLGYSLTRVGAADCVSAPVSDHPDMFMCKLGADEGRLIMWSDIRAVDAAGEIFNPMDAAGEEFCSMDMAGKKFCPMDAAGLQVSFHDPLMRYPKDIAYNAACTGRFLIHNLKHTAPLILEEAEKAKIKLIDVPQGYAKCSTVVLDKNSIITYDRGIADKCKEAGGPKALLISPGHVLLEGYNTGFIGGASGRVGNQVIFSGDLSAHPDFHAIVDFIESRGLTCKWFPEFPLTDIGSII